jgi:hypothetical protein
MSRMIWREDPDVAATGDIYTVDEGGDVSENLSNSNPGGDDDQDND